MLKYKINDKIEMKLRENVNQKKRKKIMKKYKNKLRFNLFLKDEIERISITKKGKKQFASNSNFKIIFYSFKYATITKY